MNIVLQRTIFRGFEAVWRIFFGESPQKITFLNNISTPAQQKLRKIEGVLFPNVCLVPLTVFSQRTSRFCSRYSDLKPKIVFWRILLKRDVHQDTFKVSPFESTSHQVK